MEEGQRLSHFLRLDKGAFFLINNIFVMVSGEDKSLNAGRRKESFSRSDVPGLVPQWPHTDILQQRLEREIEEEEIYASFPATKPSATCSAVTEASPEESKQCVKGR